MGVTDGTMSSDQITVSSVYSQQHSKAELNIETGTGWQPLTSSPSEWVQFDFLESRVITGIILGGGPDGWVTAFHVKYSPDGENWSYILDADHNEKLFLGNVNSETTEVINFKLPVQARYLKIVPVKWHNKIQLRVEVKGCFVPYPTLPPTTPAPTLPTCNLCPETYSEDEVRNECPCEKDLWWDGNGCVARPECPCIVGHIPYPIGTIFEREDCSQCMCKLGGIPYCSPKVCDTCPEGLRSVTTTTCKCTCELCPRGTRFCPSSNICIRESAWCNGVKDCPDDETGCEPQPSNLRVNLPQKLPTNCKTPSCPPGFKVVLDADSSKEPGIKTTFSGTKTSQTKGGVKGRPAVKGGTSRPQIECLKFKCVYDLLASENHPKDENLCSPGVCPEGYVLEYDKIETLEEHEKCPRYHCLPPPPEEKICNVTGRTFNTFDFTEYKYDICNHILARDFEHKLWEITVKKNCSKVCTQSLQINHEGHVMTFYADLTIEFDGYFYTIEQISKIAAQDGWFTVTRLGNSLIFASNEYGFWVSWDDQSCVKIGVSTELLGKVDGLCGYFDDISSDDKRKPDGELAKTTEEFGDSWKVTSDEEVICKEQICEIDMQKKAMKMCNLVREYAFAACSGVVDVDAFVSRCIETACACYEAADHNGEAEDKCRCAALQTFVGDCLTANSDIDMIDWRAKYECPVTCEPPFVHHDCYRRRCEPTCGVFDTENCPKLDNICFPGCYCPAGYLRKGDKCILPIDCGDCECDVYPYLEYLTYDHNNFTVDGKCVYVVTRDIVSTTQPDQTHKFQVLISNVPCEGKKHKMCAGKITILYQNHKIFITTDKVHSKLRMTVDSETIRDYSEIESWAGVEETIVSHLTVSLKEISVKVTVYYPGLGISVKVPSLKYGGRLEGLCGNCNGKSSDDRRTPSGEIAKNLNEFATSWLYEGLPGGQNKEECQNQPTEECQYVSYSDPCSQLEDSIKYGQCMSVISPHLFLDWCKRDTCNAPAEYSCTSIEAYSRECSYAGYCVDWRSENCPAKECPSDKEYRSCSPPCSQTCDSLKERDPKCTNPPLEGCFCPEGKALLNGTCIPKDRCDPCDDDGHRSGDSWQKDVCTNCTCAGTRLQCETQNCALLETVCQQGYMAIKAPADVDECCDKYMCIPIPTLAPTCPSPIPIKCDTEHGQVTKIIQNSENCDQFICECKPLEECATVDLATAPPLEPGMVRDVDTTGCCPVITEVCKPEICPHEPECPDFYTVERLEIPGKCCPICSCQKPKDKCIVALEYMNAKQGGERLRSRKEKEKVLKGARDKWDDGPCRECKCVSTTSGDYQTVCNVADCPNLASSIDHVDYVIEPKLIYGQCCPEVNRTACKHNEDVYELGQKWTLETDKCVRYECIDTPKGIQKSTTLITCDTKCDSGWEYRPASDDSKECCGKCMPVACLMEGKLHPIGAEWTTPDYCAKFTCTLTDGRLQIQAVVVSCPEISEEVTSNYVVDHKPVPGQCCENTTIVACLEEDVEYAVGDVWPSPDGDNCKKIKCIRTPSGEIAKQESIETCKKDCPTGWDYKESETSCCGECIQVGCILDNEVKMIGEKWNSNDNCTHYECDTLGGQFSIVSQQESCPNVNNCPEENLYMKGCCMHCNMTTGANVKCSAEEVQPQKTIGLLSTFKPPHGTCTNKQPIQGFTQCIGTCASSTLYNFELGEFSSSCTCCRAIKYTLINVEYECKNGHTFKRPFNVPSACSCQESCSTEQVAKGGVKTGVKRG